MLFKLLVLRALNLFNSSFLKMIRIYFVFTLSATTDRPPTTAAASQTSATSPSETVSHPRNERTTKGGNSAGDATMIDSVITFASSVFGKAKSFLGLK